MEQVLLVIELVAGDDLDTTLAGAERSDLLEKYKDVKHLSVCLVSDASLTQIRRVLSIEFVRT